MKKVLLLLLAGCLILSGCQNTSISATSSAGQLPPPSSSVNSTTPMESEPDALQLFLESYSEDEIKYLFFMISTAARPNIPNATDPFPYYGFEDTSKLSSNGLFNFFLCFYDQTEADTYWDESDQCFYIPLDFVRRTLDQYFVGYHFAPEDMTFGFEYQPEKQIFIMSGLAGLDGRKNNVNIKKTEVTADGNIYIEAKPLALDEPKETGATEILVLHPTEEDLQFVSYQIIPANKVLVSSADSVVNETQIEKTVNALLAGGWLGSSWSGSEVETDDLKDNLGFTTFYCMMNPGVAYPDKIPASEYEPFIQKYFDVTTEFLHETADCDSQNEVYTVSPDISVDMLNAQARDYLRIDTIEKENTMVKASYRILFGDKAGSGDGSDSVFEGYILLKGNGEFYRILSVIVTEDNSKKYDY